MRLCFHLVTLLRIFSAETPLVKNKIDQCSSFQVFTYGPKHSSLQAVRQTLTVIYGNVLLFILYLDIM